MSVRSDLRSLLSRLRLLLFRLDFLCRVSLSLDLDLLRTSLSLESDLRFLYSTIFSSCVAGGEVVGVSKGVAGPSGLTGEGERDELRSSLAGEEASSLETASRLPAFDGVECEGDGSGDSFRTTFGGGLS